jgi:class 3 adenylate cyclase/tetratricopeptide (TPR) repeat protein
MICSNCQYENSASDNFCANCGVKLARACPSCGAPADPSANFCANCGQALGRSAAEKHLEGEGLVRTGAKPSSYTPSHLAERILQERKELSGERRTVTVLFVDMVGSTALGEQLDPEVLYRLTQDATQQMMDAVHLYEGMVAGFRGDGILALFGAPIAHEDAARRAVGAALEMQRSLGDFAQDVQQRLEVGLRFRVGLNTGRVVVGQIGDDLDIEFTALGDTVNLGARMEAAAEPGTVYVTESTYRAAQEQFEFEPVKPLSVKGKADPIVAYKAVGERSVRTRFAAATERGLTPYIGRQHELDLLNRHLEQVKVGRGQVVLISGEAGMGKSRLLLEFRRSAQEEVTWWEGQCLSFGKNIPYRPIIDIVKNAFQVEENDSEADIIERLEAGTAGWDQATQKTLPYLRTLLSVEPGDPAVLEMDPRERRVGIFDGLRALLLRESGRRPLVMVVEDLHWIDEQSEAALKALVDAIATAEVLLVLTQRPGYAHSLGERTYFDRLALSDLRPEQSVALAQSVFRQATLPQELTSLITDKGEGNPFYIEEVTKSLVESGVLREQNGNYTLAQPVEAIRVPDTIEGIILSRIDRLQGEAKAALQLASVIGREFTARLLERISDLEARLDEVLGELKALELIYQEAYFPELSYMFKHALTQDVAYRTLLRERRKRLHRLIGTAIEELYVDRLSEQVEMLAHNYYEGEAWEKSLEYLEKAGGKAAAAFANQDALDYYSRALEVCERLGPSTLETVADVAWKRGMVNWITGDISSAVTDFGRVGSAAHSLGDQRLEGLSLSVRGMTAMLDHDLTAADDSLRMALALAGEELEDVRFFASMILGHALIAFDRPAESRPFCETARELASAVHDPFMLRWWRLLGPMWLHWEGCFDDALELHRQFDVNDEDISSIDLNALWVKALSLGGKGKYQQALVLLKRILATCERVGDRPVYVRILNSMGWIHGELQDHEQAMAWNRRGVNAAQEASFPNPEVESNARLNLGDNLIALGRLDEAEEHFQHVEQIIRHPQPQDLFALWRYSQHLFHSYGELWLARGDAERALGYADECLTLAEDSNSQKNIVKGRRLRGQALMAQDKLEEAERELFIALEVAQRVGNPTQLWQSYTALGELHARKEGFDDAQKSYQEATEVIEQVANNLTDQALREVFLASNAVREVMMKCKGGR